MQIETNPEAVMAEFAGQGVIFEDYKNNSPICSKSVERHHLDDEFVNIYIFNQLL